MLWAILLLPAASGVAAFFIRRDGFRRALLAAAALGHAGLTAYGFASGAAPVFHGWLAADALSWIFLAVTSALFLAASVYALFYLAHEERGARADMLEGFLFRNAPEATFTGCLLLFLATMSLVIVSRHFGVLWVAVEATTLVSAPLIFFHRHHRSLEATWKYLLLCSVGIALALLGNFFLVVAATGDDGGHVPLLLDRLIGSAGTLRLAWLKAAFLLMLVGYGTKMGLAPLHTWLPDAHSEAPSMVSALLSGALLNCAFVAILRMQGVLAAAGQAAFTQDVLMGMGLLSMGVAAAFILGQSDFKRLLAYSSVEHMGILAFGVGAAGAASAGVVLHAVNHSLAKAALFLTAGNLLTAYQTKNTSEIRGLLRTLPASGVLWLAGFFAITGSPPFGLFVSEWMILRDALRNGHTVGAAIYTALLVVVFVAMAGVFLRMAHGTGSPARAQLPAREHKAAVAAPAALCLATLMLGVYLPAPLLRVLAEAVQMTGVLP